MILAPILSSCLLLAALPSADPVATVLNTSNATAVCTFRAAAEQVARAARGGEAIAQFALGVTSPDKELAQRYLADSRAQVERLAAEADDPLAWYLLAVEKNDLKLLGRAAAGGNVQALNALGTILAQQAAGHAGAETNRQEAALRRSFDCFRQAAEKGDPNGLVNLGVCRLRGLGCACDREQAFVCFRQAAEAGHPEAMEHLSACYASGIGVDEDEERELYWWMRARAARGNEPAARWLKERK